MPQATITDRLPHSSPYKRPRPEPALLYQIIERHYPEFRGVMRESRLAITNQALGQKDDARAPLETLTVYVASLAVPAMESLAVTECTAG